jgi:N-acetyl-anhydromuramyl-L-alanine amidase AmpD
MLLKVGSRGSEVKQLQEFLKIDADGIFGKGTKASVEKWQSSKGLSVDGIVGPATWKAMGFVVADNADKTYTTDTGLIISEYFMKSDQYNRGPIDAEWLFIHHTAGWENPYRTIDSWARNESRVSTEFVLGGQSVKGNNDTHDGEVVQCFPAGNWGYHLGKNGSQTMHKNSVAIEVNNFGYIVDGKTYAGTKVDPSQIVELDKPFRGHKTWHRYSDKQIESLRQLILFIGERDGIDIRAGLPALIKEKGADAFEWNEDAYYGRVKGLWTHTNTRKDKYDMFPQQELLDMLTSL